MKLEIKTEVLKNILDKAIKASGRMEMFPKTTIVGLSFDNNTLTFTTTDRVNTLIIKETSLVNLTPEDTCTYLAVNSDLLSKLVSKTTAETITLESDGKELILKGNGRYSLPIIFDHDASPLRISIKPLEETVFNSSKVLSTQQLKSILTYNKPSVLKSSETPYLTGYYIDKDGVITFNTITACVNYQEITDEQLLLPSSFVELFSILEAPDSELCTQGNVVKLISGNITLYSTLLENIEKFPSLALKNITKETFPSRCSIDKKELFKVLDRISLFIKPADDNSIRLTFENNLKITSKDKTGEEQLEFSSSENTEKFEQNLDIQDLKNQLQANPCNEITLLYGNERGLMIQTENIYQLIPFMISE